MNTNISELQTALQKYPGIIGELPLKLNRGYHNVSSTSVKVGTDAAVSAVRAYTELVTSEQCPPGSVINCTGNLTVRVIYLEEDATTTVGYTTFLTNAVIPATYDSHEYSFMYFDFKMNDNSVVPLDTKDVVVSLKNSGPKKAHVIKGPLFIWYANSKIHVQGSDGTRYVTSKSAFALNSSSGYEFTLGSSDGFDPAVCFYICLDSSGNPYVKKFSQAGSNDYYVAIYYRNSVITDEPYVIVNKLPILPIYCRASIPIYINDDRLGYKVAPTHIVKKDGNDPSRYYTFGPTHKLLNAQGGTIHIDFDRQTDATKPKNNSITQNSASVSNKTILMVGDSITNRGWIQRQMLVHDNSLTFVGSYDTGIGLGIGTYKCEAYPGATSVNMIAAGQSAGGSANHINGNYSSYVANYLSGSAPDIVTIEFGLNENDATAYRETVQDLIDMIKSYDSANSHTTKIYVMVPFERCMTENIGANYNFVRTERLYVARQLALEAYELTDCVLIPTNMIFDDRYDYTHTNDASLYGYDVSVNLVADFVHPSEAVGFKKLGDMVYTYLGL